LGVISGSIVAAFLGAASGALAGFWDGMAA
jgi:hypothetical protein